MVGAVEPVAEERQRFDEFGGVEGLEADATALFGHGVYRWLRSRTLAKVPRIITSWLPRREP